MMGQGWWEHHWAPDRLSALTAGRVTVLIIFGLRVFFHTVGEGVFHCQRCGGDRNYRLRSGRRFFTLFFVPVIPLNKVGEHVQCVTCRTRYHADVLSLPTASQMQAALPAGMRAAAAAMLRAGDPASHPARQRALEAITGAGAQGYDSVALDEDLAAPPDTAATALAQLGGQLAVPAREWFLAEVVRIGMADGPLTGSERGAAHLIGAGMGMTQAQALGVITLTEQGAATE
jgi:zinc ribbon protein